MRNLKRLILKDLADHCRHEAGEGQGQQWDVAQSRDPDRFLEKEGAQMDRSLHKAEAVGCALSLGHGRDLPSQGFYR